MSAARARRDAARVALALALAACAPAAPSLLGGRTTPTGRVDLGGGAAVRIPLGELERAPTLGDSGETLTLAAPGGVAPVAWARYGLSRDADVAVLVVGPSLRVELRGAASLAPFVRVVGGVGAYGGYVLSEPRQGTEGGQGGRFGALAPVAIAVDAAGIAEIWLGARVGFEHLEGALRGATSEGAHATTFRAGGMLGLAIGFRPVHVMVELAIDAEHVRGARGDVAFEATGPVLTPSSAIRLRF